VFSPEFTGQRAQIIFHDHTPHLEYSDCHYQMFVACVPLSTKHFKCSLSSIPDSFLVQVAVKDMLVLRWTQRGHCGRPKGHIRAPRRGIHKSSQYHGEESSRDHTSQTHRREDAITWYIPTIPWHSKIKKCEYKLNELFYGQSSNRRNRRARFSTKLNMSGS